jgi:hypothetical protein
MLRSFKINAEKRNSYLLFLASCLISCFIAFLNKFPICYTDSGTYITTGFDHVFAPERPMIYGLFIRLFSLKYSLWLVIFAQGVVACYLLRKMLQILVKDSWVDAGLLAMVTVLALFTSFSFNVSILIPDIFAAFTLLSAMVLLFHERLSRVQTFVVSLIMVFSIGTHYSMLPTMFIVLFLVFLGKRSAYRRRRLMLVTALYASAWVVVPTTHYLLAGKFRLGTGGHVLMMGRLLHAGILEDYLSAFCGDNHFKICAYKDNLPWDFIWDPASPVYKTGGWEANKTEYNMILRDIFTKPEYLSLFALKAGESTVKQFFTFKTGVDRPLLDGLAPLDQIKKYFPHALKEYWASLQNSSILLQTFSPVFEIPMVILAMAVVFLMAVCGRRMAFLDPRLIACCRLLLIFCLSNAFVCATFSGVDYRYQNRLVWLFPFLVILGAAQYLQYRYGKERDAGFSPGPPRDLTL